MACNLVGRPASQCLCIVTLGRAPRGKVSLTSPLVRWRPWVNDCAGCKGGTMIWTRRSCGSTLKAVLRQQMTTMCAHCYRMLANSCSRERLYVRTDAHPNMVYSTERLDRLAGLVRHCASKQSATDHALGRRPRARSREHIAEVRNVGQSSPHPVPRLGRRWRHRRLARRHRRRVSIRRHKLRAQLPYPSHRQHFGY